MQGYKSLHEPMKHPIKQLDNFRIGDWVIETYQFATCDMGRIQELIAGKGGRFAWIRKTDGTKTVVDIDHIRHLEPELVVLLTDVDKNGTTQEANGR